MEGSSKKQEVSSHKILNKNTRVTDKVLQLKGLLMAWQKNNELRRAILGRLKVLLKSNDPGTDLKEQTKQYALEHPELDLVKDYSIIEDLVIQEIILTYKDHTLDTLWSEYNRDYFLEDTPKYKSKKVI